MMSNWYSNLVLSVIALLLALIVAKLYLPDAQRIGPQISLPTRGDVVAARSIGEPEARRRQLESLRARVPVVWVGGGDIEVTGRVDVDNTVEVEGEVSIVR